MAWKLEDRHLRASLAAIIFGPALWAESMNPSLATVASAAVGPVRVNGGPAGLLPKGKPAVALTLDTETESVCRWSTRAGTDYDIMSSVFMSSMEGRRHQFPLRHLVAGSHTYFVRCKDAAGTVNPADFAITFQIPDVTPPSRPEGFTAIPAGPTDINLRWEPAVDDVAVVKYWIYRDSVHVATVAAPASLHRQTALSPGKFFLFQVRAVDAAGNASASATAGASTAAGRDGSGPEISDVEPVDLAAEEVTIFWNTDELSDSAVEFGLTAELGQGAVDRTMRTSHEVVLRGLRPNTEYQYRVRSRDAGGNIRVSAGHRFKTNPGRVKAVADAAVEEKPEDEEPRAYPNPWLSGAGTMTLRNLPPGKTVRVLTMEGRLIRDLTVDVDGSAHWDGTNAAGDKVPSGIYLAVCGSALMKIAAH